MTYPAREETPKKRSGGLTALAILNFVFGAFGICGGILGFVVTAVMPLTQSLPIQMPEGMVSTGLAAVGGIVSLALGVGLIVAGVGLLKVIGWGRTLSLWVAGLVVFWTLLNFLYNMIYIIPRMAEMGGLPEETGQASVIVAAVSGVLSTICTLIYPVILLVLLNTESMKTQFLPLQSPGEGDVVTRPPTEP